MTVFNQQNQTVTGNQFNKGSFSETKAPQAGPPEATILSFLEGALARLGTAKPNDRSSVDRHFAVAINDLEHLIAYFKTYIYNKE